MHDLSTQMHTHKCLGGRLASRGVLGLLQHPRTQRARSFDKRVMMMMMVVLMMMVVMMMVMVVMVVSVMANIGKKTNI